MRITMRSVAALLLLAVMFVTVADVGSVEPVYNVVTFGAKPNDATEDTAAIQQVIDHACEQGGTVYIPAGVYISGSLKVCSGVTIAGDGYESVIQAKNDIMGVIDPGSITRPVGVRIYDHLIAPKQVREQTYNVTIRNLKLVGNSAGQWNGQRTPRGVTNHGVYLSNAVEWQVDRVWAEDFDGDGFYFGGSYGSALRNVLRDCVAYRNYRNGVSITDGRENVISGCRIEANQRGTVPDDPKYAPSQYRAADVDLEPNTYPAGMVASRNIIENNVIRGSHHDCVVLTRPGVEIAGNIIRNNIIENCGRAGLIVFADGAKRNIIQGNVFRGTFGGLVAQDGAGTQNCFIDNDFSEAQTGSPHLVFTGRASDPAAVGNVFGGTDLWVNIPAFVHGNIDLDLQMRSGADITRSAPSWCRSGDGQSPPTATLSPTPSATSNPTVTETPAPTGTLTPTATATHTPTPTATPEAPLFVCEQVVRIEVYADGSTRRTDTGLKCQ